MAKKMPKTPKAPKVTKIDLLEVLEDIKKREEENRITTEVVIYTPHPKQRLIAEDPHRFKVACVGRQFGKTHMAIGEMTLQACEKPNSVYWYIAPFFAQAKDIAWGRLKETLNLMPSKMYRLNESELTATFWNGSIIKLMGAENPDRLRGAVLDGIVCDEYAFWSKGETFMKVIRPALSKKKGWCIFISTPNGYNFFYDIYCLEALDPEEWKSFHFVSADNPYLSEADIEKARQTSDPLTFAQEWLAEFNKPVGAIWADFSRTHHVIPKYRPEGTHPIYASIDFGFAMDHPTAFFLHELGPDGIVKTFDGFLAEGKDPNQIVTMINQYSVGLPLSVIYCDSARPDLIATLSKAGFPAKKADKDVELGIAKVAEYMRVDPLTNKPRWQICGHMKDQIAQIESYRWQQVATGDGHFKSIPLKEDDDAPDALRYFLYTFSKPNKDLQNQANTILRRRIQESFID